MPAPDDTAAPRWTPGPWLYEQRLLWRGNRKLMPEELVKLPDISGWIDGALNEDEEALANATLIAAAPTMAEALTEAVLQIEYLHEKFAVTGTGEAVLARGRAALALARGESK